MGSHLLWIVLQNLAVLYVTLEVTRRLLVIPLLQVSWLDLFETDPIPNPYTAPWSWKIPARCLCANRWLGVIFAPLVMTNIPFGDGWDAAIKYAAMFGVANIVGGFSIGAGLASAIPWLWFSYQGMENGLGQAQLHRFVCYMIAYGSILVLVLSEEIQEHIAQRR